MQMNKPIFLIENTFFSSVQVTMSSLDNIILSPVEILYFGFHLFTFLAIVFLVIQFNKSKQEILRKLEKKLEQIRDQDSKTKIGKDKEADTFKELSQNIDSKFTKIYELIESQSGSKNIGEISSDFVFLIENRIVTVVKNISNHFEKQEHDSFPENHQQFILKIRSEITKKLFPSYRISNIDSLIVNIVYELSKYVSELLGCNTSDLSQYHLIPEQIEELARISVEIQHDAKCANSSSDFWREVKGTIYDLSRHKAVNYNPEVYKALGRENQNITSYDSKPYAKIAFTIAPGYSIFDHLHKKERVLVPALVYLDENVEI